MSWKDDTELFQLMRARLYTAIVGDRLDQRGRRHQFCRPSAARSDMTVAGRAMTVLEADIPVGQEPQEPAEPFGRILEALDSLCPNEVYLAAGSSAPYALWGELMSTAARVRGATGSVLLGYTRDARPVLWYAGEIGGLPRSWVRVGQWTIPNSVVVGDTTVSIFAAEASEVTALAGQLREFRAELPRDVQQRGLYTETPGAPQAP